MLRSLIPALRPLHRYAYLIVCLLFILSRPAFSEEPITREMRREDARLEQKVSLILSQTSIGELLQSLSTRSGVIIEANETDHAGDVPVSIFIKDVPLADVLNAVWSLVSYKGAAWVWERTPQPNQIFHYTLICPPAARRFPERMAQMVQDEFEKQAESLFAHVSGNPLPGPQGEWAKNLLEMEMSKRLRQGLKTIFEITTPEMRQRLLRGQTDVRIPVSQLSPAGQAFVHSVWEASKSENIPEPKWIQVNRDMEYGEIAPSIYIMMDQLGGYNYIGGTPLKNLITGRLDDLWLLSGDSRQNSLEETPIKVMGKIPDEFKQQIEADISLKRLWELHSGAGMQIIARMAERLPSDPMIVVSTTPFPGEKDTVHFALRHLAEKAMPQLRYKWHSAILLLAASDWFLKEKERSVPWAVKKRLRRHQAEQEGFLSISDISFAASQLSMSQMLALAKEFPILAQASRFQGFFASLYQTSELKNRALSKTGIALVKLPAQVQGELQSMYRIGNSEADILALATVRLSEREETREGKIDRILGIGFYKSDGTYLGGMLLGSLQCQIKP